MSEQEDPTSISDIWESARREFERLTGKQLQPTSAASLQGIRDTIAASRTSKDPDTEKAKAAGLRIVKCLQLLGGVASQAASLVFPPAGVCFSALSFLLDIPPKLHGFHAAVDSIFIEIEPTLVQFEMYRDIESKDAVHPDMILAINKVMISFVTLCAICIKFRDGGFLVRLKANLKKAMFDEAAIQDELAHFKDLIQTQKVIEGTWTIQQVIETKRSLRLVKDDTERILKLADDIKDKVGIMSSDQQKRRTEQTTKNYLEKIRNTLGISDNQVTSAISVCDNMWKSTVKGSGDWLNRMDEYVNWVKGEPPETSPLLLLTGDGGCGKSVITSVVYKNLDKRSSLTEETGRTLVQSAGRALVAYYAFSPTGKIDDDKTPAETALKCLCVQLAQQDAAYAKQLAESFKDNTDCAKDAPESFRDQTRDTKYFRDADCQQLWTDLKLGAPTQTATHFLLLDGIDNLPVNKLQELGDIFQGINEPPEADSRKETRSGARVLVCGSMQKLESLGEAPDGGSQFPTIDVGACNGDDIDKYIERELQNADLFQAANAQNRRLKEDVQAGLKSRAEGSFTQVRSDISMVKGIVESEMTEDDLKKALSATKKNAKATVTDDIASLEALPNNQKLIEEVNELLLWVDFGPYYYNVAELEALLLLRFEATSLKSLQEKLQGTYSKLLFVNQDGDVLLMDHVKEHVELAERAEKRASNERTISINITITNADTESIQRFFWDLGRFGAIDQFKFAPSGISADSSGFSPTQKKRIGINETDSHLIMLKTTFSLLFSSPTETTELVGPKLLAGLISHLSHLRTATEADELSAEDRRFVARNLLDVFHNPEHLENHWKSTELIGWTENQSEMDSVWGWLKDPVAISKLDSPRSEWLAAATEDWNPSRKLLTPFMTMLARRWLQDREWQPLRPCTTILNVLIMTSEDNRGLTDAVNLENDAYVSIKHDELDQIRPLLIEKASKWCKVALEVEETDFLWHLRLGETYSGCQQLEKAREEYGKAVQILQETEASGKEIDKNELRDLFLRMGRLSIETEQLGYYEQALQLDPDNIETRYRILKNQISSCTVEEQAARVREALTIGDGLQPGSLEPILDLVVEDYKDGSDLSIFAVFNAVISGASLIPECWPELLRCMDNAIEKAESEGRFDDLAILHLHKGIAASLCGKDYTSRSELEHWQECWTVAKENNIVQPDSAVTALLVGENSDSRSIFSILLMLAGDILSKYYFDQTRLLLEEDEQFYQNQIKQLERIATDQLPDGMSSWTKAKCYLASQYVLRDQLSQAQALFRWDMAAVFNILTDDDAGNDWLGYGTLAHILTHCGDYENAGIAYKLIPPAFLDQEVLTELLNIGDEGAAATQEIIRFYASNCPEEATPLMQVMALQSQVAKLSEQAAEEDSQHWQEIAKILQEFKDVLEVDWYLMCDSCEVRCGFNETFWSCGFCYCTHFCESCYQKLSAKQKPRPFVCSEAHDWFRLPVWDSKRFALACRGRLPGIESDGKIVVSASAEGEAISARKWLGYLCGKWDLNKEDWGFE
ncbi:uncharacterized protein N7482_006619 [Penicillium canariense]|uniref:Fungal STAND N-terminal Goodbye domain-containing protein n=1 Tax=Penicillium canariense TaxID=189055 RepID=A0A9W9HXM9_9EURO|nr:uncharacterized protein N7482_006619 [Penicillium canariense]KAJ5159615.1 hypothetical protein N7482_006619 [Penicillium canariense]